MFFGYLLKMLFSATRKSFRPLFSRALSAAAGSSRPEPQVAADMLQIGTRRIFEHEHDMYRQMCRDFYRDKVLPHNTEWEKRGYVSREVWKEV